MPDTDQHEDLFVFCQRNMNPEAWRPTVPIAVIDGCKGRPQLLAVWLTIKWLIVLYANEGRRGFGVREIADQAGVSRSRVMGYVEELIERGLLKIAGYEEVSKLKPRPIYQIDMIELEQRSGPVMVEIVRARGIRRPLNPSVQADQLPLSPHDDNTVTSEGQAMMLSPDTDNDPNEAAECQIAAPCHPEVTGACHSTVTTPSPEDDKAAAHAWINESMHESDDGSSTLPIDDLAAALRALLPGLLAEIAPAHAEQDAPRREFEPPGPLDVPEPAPDRAPLPAHPWRLWVAACPSGATERDWLTLVWLAGQHGWHWLGEAILQIANGSGIDSTKRIKIKLDWWRRNNNYGANNQRYEQMLAAEKAPLPLDVSPVEDSAAAADEEPTETEQYLIEQGFSATTAHEFRQFDLGAAREACRSTLLGLDGEERNLRIGRLVQRWRRQPPVAAAEEPETTPEPAAAAPEEQGDELQEMWRRVVGLLRMRGRTWEDLMLLEGCRLASLGEGQAIVACPDSYRADQLGRHHNDELEQALAEVVGVQMRLQIVVRR